MSGFFNQDPRKPQSQPKREVQTGFFTPAPEPRSLPLVPLYNNAATTKEGAADGGSGPAGARTGTETVTHDPTPKTAHTSRETGRAASKRSLSPSPAVVVPDTSAVVSSVSSPENDASTVAAAQSPPPSSLHTLVDHSDDDDYVAALATDFRALFDTHANVLQQVVKVCREKEADIRERCYSLHMRAHGLLAVDPLAHLGTRLLRMRLALAAARGDLEASTVLLKQSTRGAGAGGNADMA